MPCLEHDWFMMTACPTCESWKVTAPVTAPAEPEPEDLDIPKFLQRSPDGGWAFPDLHKAREPKDGHAGNPNKGELAGSCSPAPRHIREWSDAELAAATSQTMSISDRQPILRELHRRQDLSKKRASLQAQKENYGVKEKQEWEREPPNRTSRRHIRTKRSVSY